MGKRFEKGAEMMVQHDQYIEQHREAFQDALCEFLRIQSVSADPAYRSGIRQGADWVASALRRLGLDTEVVATDGHPIVIAQSPSRSGRPTALVYGHYDVQPPDPLEEWISPPFEPTIRDGNIFARGATDDKGQLLTHILAAQTWKETDGEFPIQLKFVIEGEEEVGSKHLEALIAGRRKQLSCDCIVISDMSQFAPGRPAITYGLRGIAYYELRLRGPRQDLHSGTFGGAVTNPANTLAALLAGMVDQQGRIQLPGFYDDVVPVSEQERRRLRDLAFDEAAFAAQIGVNGVSGEQGFSTLERRWTRPSFDVNGMWGGYQGEGAKTVLPARAGAKFSLRLVPDQQPAAITRQLHDWLAARIPPGIDMELQDHHGSSAVVVSLDSPYIKAASRAIEHGFGRPPVMIREGGSIPIVGMLAEQLDADTLLLGWGQNDDNMHSPNEKFSLTDFHRGIKSSTRLWKELAEC